MKTKILLLALAALLILCVANSYAANNYGPFWITKSNETLLPDANYASVYINDDYPINSRPGDAFHYLVTVYPNESILVPDSNYGIQSFGLNYNGDLSKIHVSVLSKTDNTEDSAWNISFNSTSSFGPFGIFVIDGDTTGKKGNRRNPLRIYIGSNIQLTVTDFYKANEDQHMFACHIAGFQDMGGGVTEITSAKFALPIPTVIELSGFEVVPGNRRATIKWTTASEIDNAGFNIYRSESEDGTYVKINNALIPAEGSPAQGAAYEFTDAGVQNRKVYFYKLEDFDVNGDSVMHGPISVEPRWILGIGK
jgi:hypothetical protein